MSWLGMGAVATPAHSRTLSAAAERPDSFPDGPTGGDSNQPALSSLRNAQQLRVKTGSLGAASSPTADSFLKNLTKAPRVLPITSQPPTPTNKSESAGGKSNAVLHSPTLHPFSPTMLDNYSGFRQKTPKSGASRQQSPTSASRGGARGGWDFSGISSSGVHREKMLKPVELSSDTDAAAAAGAASQQKPVKAMSARASAASRGGAVTTAAAKGSKTAKASSGKKKGGFFSFSIPKLQLWRIGGGEQDSKAKDTTPQDAKSAATSRPETQTKKKRSKKRKKKTRSNATPQSARPSRDSDGKPAALYIPAGSMTSRIERRDQSKGTSANITDSSSSDENASDLGPMYPTGEAMRARNFKRQAHIKERAKRLADMAESIRPQTARPAIAAPNTPFERFQRDRERAEKLKEKKQKRENRSKSGNPSSPALRPQTSRSRRDAKSVPRDFDGGIDEYKREARRMRRLRLRSRGSPEIERPQTGLRNASPEAETGVLRSARGRRGRGASSGGIRNVEEEVLDGPITLKTLWSAARHGRHKKMAQLIRAGLNPNTPDEHGNTALILACQNGQQKTAKLAIEAGADVNHRNAKGQTALFYSKKYGYNSVELYLKQFKATE